MMGEERVMGGEPTRWKGEHTWSDVEYVQLLGDNINIAALNMPLKTSI